MKPTAKRIGVIVIVLLVAGGGYLYFADRTTPSGQAPLTTIDTSAFADFRAEFNRAQDKVRVVVLLAPT
jgi:hypothetical protein